VDDLTAIGDLELYIEQSSSILLFCSRGYFQSQNCLREVEASVKLRKNLILVHEADPGHGGLPLDDLKLECPDRLRAAVFEDRCVIPFHRIQHFQKLTLKLIAHQMLIGAMQPSAGSIRLKWTDLHYPDELNCDNLHFDSTVQLSVSAFNPGAAAAADELASRFDAIVVRDSASVIGAVAIGHKGSASSKPTSNAPYFLLYLNCETYDGDAGQALAAEVREALLTQQRMLMLHEKDPARGGVEFGHLFLTTPRFLVDMGLYRALALGMESDKFRDVSLALVAMGLGASRSRSVWWHAQSLLASSRGKKRRVNEKVVSAPNFRTLSMVSATSAYAADDTCMDTTVARA